MADAPASKDDGGKAPPKRLTAVQRRRLYNRDMTPGQRALRDTAIVAAVNAGRPLREVATTYGLSVSGVELVVRDFNPGRSAFDEKPELILRGLLAAYERQMHDLAAVAEDTLSRAPAVAIAAMKGRTDALERYVDLLVRVGKLPEEMEHFRSSTEFNQILKQVMLRLDLFAAGELTRGEVADYLADVADGRRPILDAIETTSVDPPTA